MKREFTVVIERGELGMLFAVLPAYMGRTLRENPLEELLE